MRSTAPTLQMDIPRPIAGSRLWPFTDWLSNASLSVDSCGNRLPQPIQTCPDSLDQQFNTIIPQDLLGYSTSPNSIKMAHWHEPTRPAHYFPSEHVKFTAPQDVPSTALFCTVEEPHQDVRSPDTSPTLRRSRSIPYGYMNRPSTTSQIHPRERYGRGRREVEAHAGSSIRRSFRAQVRLAQAKDEVSEWACPRCTRPNPCERGIYKQGYDTESH
ncbi:hypothetical protein EJ07DRAFT_152324 [Lizonia empirigonia]|nr:hypothetical protein EJ07DRAFT_152324 [Lizonia empirigonia]